MLGEEPMPTWKHVTNYPKTSAEFPLVMCSAMDEQFHLSKWKHVRYMRKNKPYPTVSLSPETAQSIGAKEGDWVWIETNVGRIMQKLAIAPELDPRVVLTSTFWWFPEAGEATSFGWDISNVNVLLPDSPAEPSTGQVLCHGYPCRVYKVEEGEVKLPPFDFTPGTSVGAAKYQ